MSSALICLLPDLTADEPVRGQKVLGLCGRFEPLHLPLSPSRWPIRVLSPIIQISALSVLDAGKSRTLSDTIAARPVGHNYPQHIFQIGELKIEQEGRLSGHETRVRRAERKSNMAFVLVSEGQGQRARWGKDFRPVCRVNVLSGPLGCCR